jgi:hypothetical protein
MAIPGVALARAAPAYIGSPYVASDAGCFFNYYGAAQNTCTTTKGWCIPAVVDAPGSYTVTVWAFAPSPSATVGCGATGVNAEITSVWSSGTSYVSSFGSPRPITLTGAYVPPNGQMFVCCDVGPGASVHGILW